MVHVMVHGKRHIGVGAVNRTGGSVYQVFHAVVAAAFQYIHETHQVGIHVGMRVLYGITYPRLGRQVYHTLWLVLLKKFFNARPVCHIQFVELKQLVVFQQGQPVFFQLYVVIIIEVIQAQDHVTPLHQSLAEGSTNKARSTGHQYFHDSLT